MKEEGRRFKARLGAVQAVYWQAFTGWQEKDLEGYWKWWEEREKAEEAHWWRVVEGVKGEVSSLDTELAQVLSAAWPLERLDVVLQAVLRCGAWEITQCEDVPVRVVLDEYVEVAKAFFGGKEPGMVNGVLDALARRLRAPEMA